MTTDSSPIGPRLVWVTRILLFLGFEKALAAAFGLGILFGAPVGRLAPDTIKDAIVTQRLLIGSTALLWYGANAALAIVVARGLRHRRHWARLAAILFGAFHAFGIAGFVLFGPIVLLNGVLGIFIAVLVLMSP